MTGESPAGRACAVGAPSTEEIIAKAVATDGPPCGRYHVMADGIPACWFPTHCGGRHGDCAWPLRYDYCSRLQQIAGMAATLIHYAERDAIPGRATTLYEQLSTLREIARIARGDADVTD
jgi:hypothetical protein